MRDDSRAARSEQLYAPAPTFTPISAYTLHVTTRCAVDNDTNTVMAGLQFAPWTSDVELPFYTSLSHLKINHDKLDSSARKVRGLYQVDHRDVPERSTRMQIHGSALTSDTVPAGYCRAEGLIRNFNTIDEYRSVDAKAHIERAARTVCTTATARLCRSTSELIEHV